MPIQRKYIHLTRCVLANESMYTCQADLAKSDVDLDRLMNSVEYNPVPRTTVHTAADQKQQ